MQEEDRQTPERVTYTRESALAELRTRRLQGDMEYFYEDRARCHALLKRWGLSELVAALTTHDAGFHPHLCGRWFLRLELSDSTGTLKTHVDLTPIDRETLLLKTDDIYLDPQVIRCGDDLRVELMTVVDDLERRAQERAQEQLALRAERRHRESQKLSSRLRTLFCRKNL